MRLPDWVDSELGKRGVVIERYGRDGPGPRTLTERRWLFCGWYWHVAKNKKVVEGPFGPFPCFSAAMADAVQVLRLPTQRP